MKTKLKLILLSIILVSCTSKQKTWIALGDSITYLNEHRNETDSRITKGYMTLVSEQLPRVSYVNKGYNGWTAVRIAKEIESLDLTTAEVYTIFLGTNDWWHGEPIGTLEDYKGNTGNDTFFGAYRTIINKLRSLNKDAQIIPITPMQRGDFVSYYDMTNNAFGSYRDKGEQTLEQFANAIVSIAEHEKFDVVDLYHDSGITMENMVKYKRMKDPANGEYKNFPYPDYIDVPFNPDTDEYPYPVDAIDMTYDGLHPSDKGYEVIARMLVPLMKKGTKSD
jgi:lysophospholipase L1-like esterase